jgi:hypothetical protein
MSDIYTWLPQTNKLYVLYTVIGILSLLLCDIFVDFYLLNKMWMEIYGFRCRIIKLYIYFVHICRRNIVQKLKFMMQFFCEFGPSYPEIQSPASKWKNLVTD